jgi:hypothetical protein
MAARVVPGLMGMLDVLNRHRFRNDKELLAALESVSKVAGPFRAQVEPGGSEGRGVGSVPDGGRGCPG